MVICACLRLSASWVTFAAGLSKFRRVHHLRQRSPALERRLAFHHLCPHLRIAAVHFAAARAIVRSLDPEMPVELGTLSKLSRLPSNPAFQPDSYRLFFACRPAACCRRVYGVTSYSSRAASAKSHSHGLGRVRFADSFHDPSANCGNFGDRRLSWYSRFAAVARWIQSQLFASVRSIRWSLSR